MSTNPILAASYKNALSEITTMQNELIDYARIDKIEPTAITFIPFRPRFELTRLDFGMPLKVNVFNNTDGFKALSGSAGLSTASQLRVMGLEVICASDRRQFVRIKTNARGDVTLLASDGRAAAPATRPVKVHIVDLSMGGAEIATPMKYDQGSFLMLKFELYGYALEFVCTIRRAFRKSERDNSFYYGCRFEDISLPQEEALHKILLRLQQERRSQYR